jgi:hypothetical protein
MLIRPLPLQLQVSDRYIQINKVWDRVEKCIYLVVDAGLNTLFIRVVKERLVDRGLDRYKPLVRHNQRLILLSIGCDALIIGVRLVLCLSALVANLSYPTDDVSTELLRLHLLPPGRLPHQGSSYLFFSATR